jgi:hypothetical protein
MVKVMRKLRTVTSIFVMLILALTLVKSTTAQTPEEMQTFFSRKYVGISIQVNATRETVPGANITIKLLVNCTADDVYVDYLNLSVYGYKHVEYALEKATLRPICVIKQTFLVYHNASQHNYTIPVPNDVWDLTYAELHLKYTISGELKERDETFSITTVKNVRWEELEEKYQKLNNTYWQLNSTVEQLNQTFWQMFQMNLTAESLALLNETYWGLKGSSNELGNTRMAVGILAVTTVFFVATTLYLVMRKPKESW